MPVPESRRSNKVGRKGEARAKLVPRGQLASLGARLRRQGRRVVFTNGVFDLLHPGHVALLEAARRLGDLLVVGINSDASVRRLSKGPGRPIVKVADRAIVMAALRCVDHVTIFGEDTPLETIRLLKPHVLVKGSDWGEDAIVGSDEVRLWGGRVVRVKLKSGYSTTRIVERIRRGGRARG
ncbi:MAG: D-glycero-beta-D-manno-heptose 1-phosphate adenylyltransferase [Acidobacteria bacterium]|nr:D-glycero-beta-D-manno-heptose 1-phosphate adenylyltransferase [Acidobacteriota bacterium]